MSLEISLSDEWVTEVQTRLPLFSRLKVGGLVFAIVAMARPIDWLREWYSYLYPSEFKPNMTKTYDTRPNLPVRIFTPATYPISSSPTKLPTILSIHGGGFTIGTPAGNDKWNRVFADTQRVLVIALNYSKAPFHPFPAAIYDLETLISAILADPSLPIDKHRCAISGFSAGGNLALAVSQLQSLKAVFKSYGSNGFRAAVPLYPGLDRSVSREYKATQRYYKPALSANRNSKTDILLTAGKAFDWSYIPVGQDLKDPLLSPIFAARENLPPHVFIVGCELDMTSHDAWRMACRLAGRPQPPMDEKAGREKCGEEGELELGDQRFAWDSRESGVRWLLVPDVVHGFDGLPQVILGDQTSVNDTEMKTVKLMREIGDWLQTGAWV